MSPILLNLNEFLTICAFGVAGGALLGYVLVAWNNTPLPVFLSQLLARIFFRKESTVFDMHTRNEWMVWSHFELPRALAHWLNCPICQIPWLVVGLYGTLFLCGVLNGVIALLAASVAIKLALRTQHAAPAIDVTAKRKPILEEMDSKVPVRNGPLFPDPRTVVRDAKAEAARHAAKNREAQPENMEGVTEVGPPPVLGKEAALRQHADSLLGFQEAFGLKMTKASTGGYIIDPKSIGEEMRQLVKFFVETEPCWFEGCDKLRGDYKAELEALGGADCTSCQQGDLTRKYMLLIKERYPHAINGKTTSNPGN